MHERMVIWAMIFVLALVCGLPINHVTVFWVGILTALVWKGSNGDN